MHARNLYRGIKAAVRAFRLEPDGEIDLEKLRRKARPDFFMASFFFLSALWWLWLDTGTATVRVEGRDVLTLDGVIWWVFLGSGLRSLWVSPDTRLLLKLAENAAQQEKNSSPAPGPKPMIAEARARG